MKKILFFALLAISVTSCKPLFDLYEEPNYHKVKAVVGTFDCYIYEKGRLVESHINDTSVLFVTDSKDVYLDIESNGEFVYYLNGIQK